MASGILFTFDEAPSFRDWRHFFRARWRWLRRRVPFLRRETTAMERFIQASRAQGRAYEEQWRAAKVHMEAGTAHLSNHPHLAYLNALANSQQAYMANPLQQALMQQQAQISPYQYRCLQNRHVGHSLWGPFLG